MGKWCEVPLVSDHINQAAEHYSRNEYMQFQDYIRTGGYLEGLPLGSPLEAVFAVWWEAENPSTGWWGRTFAIVPQAEIEAECQKYRLDFVVGLSPAELDRWRRDGIEFPRIAVELDGHAFHEKTKEQVTYRNERDRKLQRQGWHVFHYSFSEMTTHPDACVMEVTAFAVKEYHRIRREWSDRQWEAKRGNDQPTE